MRLTCVIKFVPDVDNFNYDFGTNTLIRGNSRLILNPDDACAIALALKVKDINPDTFIEAVTMAPLNVISHMEDLLRVGVDKGTLLTDTAFAGSDTYATSKIISKYLSSQTFDWILTGTHAVDGDTAHIPAQLGEWLNLNQLSSIVSVDTDQFSEKIARVDVDHDNSLATYEIDGPAILSITRESGYKLPFIKRGDMNKDVKAALCLLNKDKLGLYESEVGQRGSLTQVVRTYTKQYEKKDRLLVKADEAGAETVVCFLKEKGFL